MKVTTQTLDDRQVELFIQPDEERVQQALQHTARQIGRNLNVPGFRKGKAPYAVIVRTLGEDTLYEEMFKELGPQLVQEALQQAELVVYQAGQISALQFKPLSFKVTFSLPPVVELGDYRALRVPFEVPGVAEEDVDDVLRSIQERHTLLEPAGEGPAEWKQVATLRVTAQGEEGAPPLVLSEDEDDTFDVLLDEQRDAFLPGFSAHVIGMRVGESKTFDVQVPDDFESEDLRGRTVTFNVTLSDLKRLYTPPLDDALAQTVGNFETLAALRADVRHKMESSALARAESAYADMCLARLAEQARIEFPPVTLEEEIDRLVDEARSRLQAQHMSLEEFLNIKKQTLEVYREEMKPRATSRLRQRLAFVRFIEAEQLFPAEDQERAEAVDKAMQRLVALCKGQLETGAEDVSTPTPAHDA